MIITRVEFCHDDCKYEFDAGGDRSGHMRFTNPIFFMTGVRGGGRSNGPETENSGRDADVLCTRTMNDSVIHLPFQATH